MSGEFHFARVAKPKIKRRAAAIFRLQLNRLEVTPILHDLIEPPLPWKKRIFTPAASPTSLRAYCAL